MKFIQCFQEHLFYIYKSYENKFIKIKQKGFEHVIVQNPKSNMSRHGDSNPGPFHYE